MEKSKKIILANWKMKLGHRESIDLAKAVAEKFKGFDRAQIGVCPNFISLLEVKKILKGSGIALGGQDVFWESKGAYTGEISPDLLEEVGCRYAIVGHSERRKYLMVNYEMVHRMIKAVLTTKNIIPVVCIGENWDERKTDRRDFVLYDQIQQSLSGIDISVNQKVVVAYEPIWAIGSGTAIEPSEAEYAHKIIRLTLNDIFGMGTVNDNFQIIYGGSITSKNAKGFVDMENLDGLLVGGASLDAEEFFKVADIIA